MRIHTWRRRAPSSPAAPGPAARTRRRASLGEATATTPADESKRDGQRERERETFRNTSSIKLPPSTTTAARTCVGGAAAMARDRQTRKQAVGRAFKTPSRRKKEMPTSPPSKSNEAIDVSQRPRGLLRSTRPTPPGLKENSRSYLHTDFKIAISSVYRTRFDRRFSPHLGHDRLPAPVVDVAHQVVQVVDGVEAHARLRLQGPQSLGQVVFLQCIQRAAGPRGQKTRRNTAVFERRAHRHWDGG